MTHDELTLLIIKLSGDDTVNWKFYPALRAVVELHKPWNFGCSHCIDIEGGYKSYPCPTIKAIEKELK